MEIKIIISDTGGAAETRVSSQPQTSAQQGTGDGSAAMAGGAMGAGTGAGMPPAGAPEAGPPPEVLRQAAALGASDGGPAPPNLSAGQQNTLGPTQQGAPQPFIASRAAELFGGASGAAATHESAGPAPRRQPSIDTQAPENGGAP